MRSRTRLMRFPTSVTRDPAVEMADPKGLLDGTGKFMRHVKLAPGSDVDAGALTNLVKTAYADMKRRVKAERC